LFIIEQLNMLKEAV